MSRYLVTGAAGAIGSILVDALLARGDEVVGLDAFTDYYARALKEANLAQARASGSFRLAEVDLAADEVAPLLAGLDGVFHFAAQPGVRGSWGASFAVYLRDNVLATQRLFEGTVEAGLRVVFASSSSVYGDAARHPTPEDAVPQPISPYGVTKLACEHLAHAYATGRGLEVVTLRYFSVYGPRQRPDMAFARMLGALLDGTPFEVLGTGEQSRDFTYVGDAAAAALAAMDGAAAGAVFNVAGGSEVSIREAIALGEELVGRKLRLVHREAAVGDVARTSGDTRRIQAALGWRPVIGLAHGLSAQLDWLLAARA
jgi:nucleoside-diphosphate-sugar epimerase